MGVSVRVGHHPAALSRGCGRELLVHWGLLVARRSEQTDDEEQDAHRRGMAIPDEHLCEEGGGDGRRVMTEVTVALCDPVLMSDCGGVAMRDGVGDAR